MCMKRKSSVLAALCCILPVACGGGGSDNAPDVSTPTTPSTPTTTPNQNLQTALSTSFVTERTEFTLGEYITMEVRFSNTGTAPIDYQSLVSSDSLSVVASYEEADTGTSQQLVLENLTYSLRHAEIVDILPGEVIDVPIVWYQELENMGAVFASDPGTYTLSVLIEENEQIDLNDVTTNDVTLTLTGDAQVQSAKMALEWLTENTEYDIFQTDQERLCRISYGYTDLNRAGDRLNIAYNKLPGQEGQWQLVPERQVNFEPLCTLFLVVEGQWRISQAYAGDGDIWESYSASFSAASPSSDFQESTSTNTHNSVTSQLSVKQDDAIRVSAKVSTYRTEEMHFSMTRHLLSLKTENIGNQSLALDVNNVGNLFDVSANDIPLFPLSQFAANDVQDTLALEPGQAVSRHYFWDDRHFILPPMPVTPVDANYTIAYTTGDSQNTLDGWVNLPWFTTSGETNSLLEALEIAASDASIATWLTENEPSCHIEGSNYQYLDNEWQETTLAAEECLYEASNRNWKVSLEGEMSFLRFTRSKLDGNQDTNYSIVRKSGEPNYLITAVDENNLRLPVTHLYLKNISTEERFQINAADNCGLSVCRSFQINRPLSGQWEVYTYYSEPYPHDPLCSQSFHGEAMLGNDQTIEIKMSYVGDLCA